MLGTLKRSFMLILTCLAALPSTPVAAQTFSTTGVSTQCVRMAGGATIVATVSWWDPKTVKYTAPDPRGDIARTTDINEAVGYIDPIEYAEPLKTEKVGVGQKSCIVFNADKEPPRLAVVSADGAKHAGAILTGITAGVVSFGGGIVCIFGTAGTTCPLVAAAVTTIATTGIGIGGGMLAEKDGIFYVGTPASVEITGNLLQQYAREMSLGTATSFYRTEIDFCHSSLTDTASGNTITAELLTSSGEVVHKESRQYAFNCAGGANDRGPLTFNAETAKIVKAVRISTDGGDAMFIDQVKVQRDNKTMIVWEGRNDGNGWCLSTDPQDFQGGWEANVAGPCRASYTFDKPEAATVGEAAGASAAYLARVDFCHSSLSDTATSSNITIEFMKQGRAVASKTINGSVSDCGTFSKGYLETTINTPVVLDGVRVSTDGGDGMFIDQVEVWRDNIKVFWDGRNNGGGWCLSTDANDHIGGWEGATSGCQKSISFSNLAN